MEPESLLPFVSPLCSFYIMCFVFQDGATNFTGGTVVDREWNTHDFNFDNIFQAFLTLFVVMTFEGFPDIQVTN